MHQILKTNSHKANDTTFDKLPQAGGYLTEQVERILKIVAALQPQTAIDKHRIVEIDEACQITRKAKPTIYTLPRKVLIPTYKRGKKLYFDAMDRVGTKAVAGTQSTRASGGDCPRREAQTKRCF